MAAMLLAVTACADPAGEEPQAAPESLAGNDAIAGPQADEGTAAANDAADVDQAIDTVLGGDHNVYRDVIERVQKAVVAGDKEAVAALVSYPIEVRISGKPRKIASEPEFVAAWDGIVTPDVAQAVATQEYSAMFVNSQGVMFGDGQVWISGVCRDEACTNSDVLITAIQPAPL
ncbi:hypothetical protein E2F46_01920 [Luteimonas aestuarii]|uniref:DUF4440 domain-containing protein n=1 Tax=Luteimonas aestuarii TaxID=453837 RepID=A0A4R5U4S6_9GAMM|nr:hypothetical protein [Luteimonas aestuarii]TDK28649.1 hypothetical protein E2F46_01920 [Luteimonas aestuarii]